MKAKKKQAVVETAAAVGDDQDASDSAETVDLMRMLKQSLK